MNDQPPRNSNRSVRPVRPNRPIRAVAFDFDGLMFNTELVYEMVDQTLMERRGRSTDPAVLAQMVGRPAKVALRIMIDAYGLEDTFEELQCESQEIFLDLIGSHAEPMPGLFELLDLLESAGIPKSVATSSRIELVTPLLEETRLTDRFQFLLTSEDVTRHKPDPQIYETAAEQFSVRCDEMLVLEDSPVGCRAAVASGAYAVAVPGKHGSDHAFDGARFVADGLHDPRIRDLFNA